MSQRVNEDSTIAPAEAHTVAAQVVAQAPYYQIAIDQINSGATLPEIIQQMREAAIDDGVITFALRTALHRILRPEVPAQEINAAVQKQVAEAFQVASS